MNNKVKTSPQIVDFRFLLPNLTNLKLAIIDNTFGSICEKLSLYTQEICFFHHSQEQVDFSKEEMNKKNITNVQCIQSTFQKIPLEDNSMDGIIIYDYFSLEFLPEVYRVLKKEGFLYCVSGNKNYFKKSKQQYFLKYHELIKWEGFCSSKIYAIYPNYTHPSVFIPLTPIINFKRATHSLCKPPGIISLNRTRGRRFLLKLISFKTLFLYTAPSFGVMTYSC